VLPFRQHRNEEIAAIRSPCRMPSFSRALLA
jgi:hypothetical protein